MGIPYSHFLGHRGFTHSLFFAALFGCVLTLLFFRSTSLRSRQGLFLWTYFSLLTASHGLLDGLTNGGLGLAFFSPFDQTHYFLPWQPVKVSPLGIRSFFSERGMEVIWSEIIFIGIPVVALSMLLFFARKKTRM